MLSNTLVNYTPIELETTLSIHFIEDYRNPEAIARFFKVYIRERINALVKPKLLTESELNELVLQHSRKICDVIPSNEREVALQLRKIISDKFRAKCQNGVMLSEETDNVEKVMKEFMSPLVRKYFGMISGNQRDMRKQKMPTQWGNKRRSN